MSAKATLYHGGSHSDAVTIRLDPDQLNDIVERVSRRVVEGLRRQGKRRVYASSRTDDDDALLQKLVPAIVGRFGSATFKTSELYSDPAIRELVGDRSRSQVGMMLARIAENQRHISGYTVSRPGQEHRAACWTVLKV